MLLEAGLAVVKLHLDDKSLNLNWEDLQYNATNNDETINWEIICSCDSPSTLESRDFAAVQWPLAEEENWRVPESSNKVMRRTRYIRCPCKEHEIGSSSLLILDTKTGETLYRTHFLCWASGRKVLL